ncbi:MAG: hypothetical protein ACOCX4_01855 [Planctomycetota bacterium]
MTRRRLTAGLLVAWLVLSLSLAHAEDAPAETLRMAWQSLTEFEDAPTPHHAFVRLQDGAGRIPFATPTGTLQVRIEQARLRFDTTGDGVIDDADGPGVTMGQTIHVPVLFGGERKPYPLKVLFATADVAILASQVRLAQAEAERPLWLHDSDVNGRFDDRLTDELSGGDLRSGLPLCTILPFGDRLMRVRIVDGGATLELRPYDGPTVSRTFTSEAKGASMHATLVEVDGRYATNVSLDEPVLLPPGDYRLQDPQFNREVPPDGKTLMLFGADQQPIQSIGPDGPDAIAIGPPLTLRFEATRNGLAPRDLQIDAAVLIGQAGERYSARLFGMESTLTAHIRDGDREVQLSTLEYG